MTLPFTRLLTDLSEIGFVVALFVGFGFGFVLERAGFGRATKLMNQFYLRDMTVLKVMFTGLVTAMLGLVIFDAIGLLNLATLATRAASFTFFWPMLVAGLLLGAGFVISGYCPGTSVVAAGSGNVDGMLTVVGVAIGTLIYGEAYPLIAGFATSSNWGHFFLNDALGLSPAVTALLVVGMALAVLFGADFFEKRRAKKLGEERAPGQPQKGFRYVLISFGAGSAVLLVALAAGLNSPASAAEPPAPRLDGITAPELADRVVQEPWSMRIIDLRGEKAWTKARIPGSEPTTVDELTKLGLGNTVDNRDLVFVSSKTLSQVPDAANAYKGRVFTLRGGFGEWNRFATTMPNPPGPSASAEERSRYAFRTALNGLLTGQKAAPPPPRPVRKVGARKAAGGGGCD